MPAKRDSIHKQPTSRPEWIRVGDMERIFGIGRSVIYRLIKDRVIESVSLSCDNKKKATRLVRYESVVSYLDKLSRDQQNAGQGGNA